MQEENEIIVFSQNCFGFLLPSFEEAEATAGNPIFPENIRKN